MVDPLDPDLERYPRFQRAHDQASFADLEPGDAIYIPTLWWHHVQAKAPVNVLMNYWHDDALHGGGFLALIHAMLAIRDLPQPQRAARHLPPHAMGVSGPPSAERDAIIRQFLVRVLSAR